MTEPVIIHVACGSEAEAERIGTTLVERGLAACVHITPHRSIYRWQGRVESAGEWSLSAHTDAAHATVVQAAIRELHSYEVPAIFTVAVTADDATRHWLIASLGRPEST